MISLNYSSSGFELLVFSVQLIVIFSGMALHMHIATAKQFELMCSALQRSQCLYDGLGGGFSTLHMRCMKVSSMSATLLWPQFFIRRGELDKDDYLSFPRGLARRMRIASCLLLVAMVWISAG